MTQQDLAIFRNPPPIRAERLLLRRIRRGDLYDVFDYASNPETSRYLLWEPHRDAAFTARYLRRVEACYHSGRFFDFGVVLREGGRMIGTCGFSSFDVKNNAGELGYVLNPRYHGKGYGTEAARAVLAFGFERLALHRIYVRFFPENTASANVAAKCGMAPEGIARGAIYSKGQYHDLSIFAITCADYFARTSKNEN